jgi:hypothetical protein
MAFYDYRIAVGSSVALASLVNVETLIWPYTKPRTIAPRSQIPDLYPIRTTLGSGRVRGDGSAQAAWEFTAIPVAAVDYLMTYLWSGGTAISTAVTIYTRQHELDQYTRFNAYAVLPVPGQDVEYIRQGVLRMVIRFNDLVAL